MRIDRERLNDGDEVDLFELIDALWRQKILICLITLVVTGFAIAYALLATPIYEAKVFIQPPSQNDVAQLNFGRGGNSGLAMISVKDVYEIYLRNLQSESLRREFYRNVYLPSLPPDERKGSQDEQYIRFQEVLGFGVASKQTPSRYFVRATRPDPREAAEWVVQYIQMAGLRAVSELAKDVKSDASIKANNLEQQINAARESARKQREDQIVLLTEALKVAKSIGLEKPPIISNNLSNEVSAGMDGALIYMRGSKALEAEIDNLRHRSSDDPFVDRLRQREEELAFYRSLKVDPGVVQAYRQDGAIESPDKPIKPIKMIIITFGLILGLLLGIFVAIVRNFVESKKNSTAS